MKITATDVGSVLVADKFTVELEDGSKFTITESNDQLRIINETLGFLRITVQSKDVITVKSEW